MTEYETYESPIINPSSSNNEWVTVSNQTLFADDFTPEQKGQLVETGGSVGVVILIITAVFIGCLVIIIAVFNTARTGIYLGSDSTPPPLPANSLINTQGSGNDSKLWVYNGFNRKTKINCESDGRGIWNGITCNCVSPFWSTSCQNEGYAAGYLEIGNPIIGSGSGDDTHLDIIDTVLTDRLSFNYENTSNKNQTLCTELCNENEDCIGVVWTQGQGINQGICELFSGVSTNSVIPFNNTRNNVTTLYIKLY